MKVAVTGGTGIVGRFVVNLLASHDCEVVALHRSTSDTNGFDVLHRLEPVRWIVGDMQERTSLTSLLENCDALVHCALTHRPGKYRGGEGVDPVGFWERNFSSTLRLLDVAQEEGVSRVVLLSSRAVFDGYDEERPIPDETPPKPTTHYGLLNTAKEHLANLYGELKICSLRSTGIYGLSWPLQTTKWWSIVGDAKRGRTPPQLSDQGRTEVHGSDVAAAIHLLLTVDSTNLEHDVYNCSDSIVSERMVHEISSRIHEGFSPVRESDLTEPVMPRNRLATAALEELGWTGGGFPRLCTTIEEMLDAHDSAD